MTPENFTYWLQGFFELANPAAELTPLQVTIIRDHLRLVFEKQTPDHVHPVPVYPDMSAQYFTGTTALPLC